MIADPDRRRLAEAHVDIALRLARRLTRYHPWLRDELESEAMVCLWTAANHPGFDPARSFVAFLWGRMRWARDAMLRSGAWSAGSGGDRTGPPPAWELAEDGREAIASSAAEIAERATRVRTLLARLPRDEGAVIRMRYGIANGHSRATTGRDGLRGLRARNDFARRHGTATPRWLDILEGRALHRLRILLAEIEVTA